MPVPTRRGRSIVCALLLFLLATPLEAGGSKDDYARAKAMAGRIRGLVKSERLEHVWVDDHKLVYRKTQGDGWRFMRLDARDGTRGEAFDHAAVARAVGGGATADRLPVRPVAMDGKKLLVHQKGRVWRIGSSVEPVDLQDVPALGLAPDGARRSQGGGGEDTALHFVNKSKQAIQLIWLDHGGGHKPYGTVAPGATYEQHTFPGHVWLVRAADGSAWGSYTAKPAPRVVFVTGPPKAEDTPKAPATRPSDSPDGRYRAFLRNHNVFLRDRKTKRETPLSTDGTAGDAYRGRWSWSPDSRFLVAVQETPAQAHPVSVVNSVPRDRFQPRVRTFDYLKPGDRIRQPRPRMFDVKAGKKLAIDDSLHDTPWTIGHFAWSPDGKRFRFHYNQRGHQIVRVVELDPRRKKARALIEEAPETFVDYSQKTYLKPLDGGAALLWMSERSGWNHLYRVHARTGKAKAVTKGTWVVRRVLEVDETAGHVMFEALGPHAGQDPYHVHVGRVGLDGKGLTWLTEGDGTHTIAFSPDGTYYVDTYSRMDMPPVHELRRTEDGSLISEIERAEASALLATGWQMTEVFSAKGRDGTTDIWGVIHRPSTFDPKKRYPVIEHIYAGPHGHFVPKRWRAWSGPKAMAELGFVVVQIDGMGTNWRHKAFHDVCWKNLGDSGFPDRIAWMKAAARTRPWMDLERVGIYGGSAGGQSAMRALLAHGDFYDAAVADCGCHDNRMDKIWWNEAWMGWPMGPHYAEQSNITQAHKLTGKLFLIVGEIDQNVDPASTFKVVDALIKADKDFDLLVVPGHGHGAAGTPYARRRQADFFVRHLLGVEPRHDTTER